MSQLFQHPQHVLTFKCMAYSNSAYKICVYHEEYCSRDRPRLYEKSSENIQSSSFEPPVEESIAF